MPDIAIAAAGMGLAPGGCERRCENERVPRP